MRHEDAQEQLDAFLDDELGRAEAAAVAAHVEGCPSCREAAARWRRIRAALFAPRHAPASKAFTERVMVRVRALSPAPAAEAAGEGAEEGAGEPAGRRRAGLWLVPTLGFAFAALALVLARPGPGTAPGAEAQPSAAGREEAAAPWAPADEELSAEGVLGLILEEP